MIRMEQLMSIWEGDKLLLFIAFVIPGFVSIKTYELLIPGAPRESDKLVIDAIAYSSINYALLLLPIYLVESSEVRQMFPSGYVAFYVFVLFLAPIIWVLAFKKLRTSEFFQRSMPHPTPKPWDYVFAQRKPNWVIVTLKDGTKIAGRYDSCSFASSSPAPEQIYLEETWVLNADGGFERPRENTAGIVILSSEIVSVEFIEPIKG